MFLPTNYNFNIPTVLIIDRPGVAGAVLQTASSFIN